MGLSTVRVVMGIMRGDYRPGQIPPAAPGHGDGAHPYHFMGPDGHTPHRSRRRRPKKWIYLLLLAGAAAVLGLPYVAHALLYPWAISLTGKPTLTGYWQGEVAFAAGDRRHVVMHLRSEHGDCGNCSSIDGAVKVCTAAHATTYRLTGDVKDYRGHRFLLGITPGESGGRYLRTIDGQWPGGDQIDVAAKISVLDADRVWRSNHQPKRSEHLVMHRTSKANFKAGC